MLWLNRVNASSFCYVHFLCPCCIVFRIRTVYTSFYIDIILRVYIDIYTRTYNNHVYIIICILCEMMHNLYTT